MNVNQAILAALSGINVPVAFQTYSGKAETYITFFTYLEKAEQHADDEVKLTGHYIQIDIWAKSDYIELVKEVHTRMKKLGFRKIQFYDLYEKEAKVYHKVMRYVVEEEELQWLKLD